MVEAYLGAVFVDSNFDFKVIEDFYKRHVKPYFEDMAIYDTFANKHPTVSTYPAYLDNTNDI
jgi:endoribonuclease Dicer